jgi:hypothetical protein
LPCSTACFFFAMPAQCHAREDGNPDRPASQAVEN